MKKASRILIIEPYIEAAALVSREVGPDSFDIVDAGKIDYAIELVRHSPFSLILISTGWKIEDLKLLHLTLSKEQPVFLHMSDNQKLAAMKESALPSPLIVSESEGLHTLLHLLHSAAGETANPYIEPDSWYESLQSDIFIFNCQASLSTGLLEKLTHRIKELQKIGRRYFVIRFENIEEECPETAEPLRTLAVQLAVHSGSLQVVCKNKRVAEFFSREGIPTVEIRPLHGQKKNTQSR